MCGIATHLGALWAVAIGSVYYDKLGSAAEKAYYRSRTREETLPASAYYTITFPDARRAEFIRLALEADAEPNRYRLRADLDAPAGSKRLRALMREVFALRLQKTFTGSDVTFTRVEAARTSGPSNQRRDQLDPMLDSDFRLIESLARRDFDPKSLDETQWKPELGEMAYLRKYEPYPYGISPVALGYDYFCRAAALQSQLGQRHSQLADRVISSRVPFALRLWSDEEREHGRRLEIQLLNLPMPDEIDLSALERPSSLLNLEPMARNAAVDEMIFNYERAELLADEALAGFDRHLERFIDDRTNYDSHRSEARALAKLMRGDRFFILAKTQTGAERDSSIKAAIEAYSAARDEFARFALSYYVSDDGARAMFPEGYTRYDVMERMPAEMLEPLMLRALGESQKPNLVFVSDEIIDTGYFFARCLNRLSTLKKG